MLLQMWRIKIFAGQREYRLMCILCNQDHTDETKFICSYCGKPICSALINVRGYFYYHWFKDWFQSYLCGPVFETKK
jgi:hypothetical protein